MSGRSPRGPAGSAAPGTRGRSAAASPGRRTDGGPATSCSIGAPTVGSRRCSRVPGAGTSTRPSTAWVNLAAMTGAAVLPAYCRMDESGRFALTFEAPYSVPRDAARHGQATPWVQKALDALEEQIRRHPEQSNDYFFWGPGGTEL